MNTKSIAIILVTYNGLQWIKKCLSCAIKSEGSIDFHIYVVDNNSTDDTALIIKSFSSDKITFLQSEQNLGFGKANNLAIERALKNKPDYFYLLNQDAYLEKDTLSLLVNAHLKRPEFGILSPLHTDGACQALDHRFVDYITRDQKLEFLSDLALGKALMEIYQAKFINAAGWLISSECLHEVGGFNPVFSHYAEDNNYADRLHYHKFKLGFVPSAKMAHDRIQKVKPFNIRNSASFERQVLRRLSDPNDESFTLWGFLKWHILKSYKPLLNPIELIKRVHYYLNSSKMTRRNRELSKKPGLSFLNP